MGVRKRKENATIRTKLFYKLGVMGNIDYRINIYNSIEIFITDICEVNTDKINIDKGNQPRGEKSII